MIALSGRTLLTSLLLAGLLLCRSAPSALAETKAEKLHEIVQLSTGLTSTTTQRMIDALWPQMASALLRGNHAIPADVLDGLRGIFVEEYQAALPDLIRKVEGLYAATYTDQEVDALYAFYTSPVGRSVMAKQSVILPQTLALTTPFGQQVAQKVLPRLVDTLKSKGYELH
ncbi:MAG: DUF2059 domain-containing protein [Telmatospirillum sp.]|nr:DUF2059 domain-containing protein [Telmatospirillum sp.]